jgi:hypothetical protein
MVQCKIWIKRNIPYRYPSFEYQQTEVHSRSNLRQCVNLYLPMHSWTKIEQKAILKQVTEFAERSWTSKQKQQKHNQMEISIVEQKPMICYTVGGAWTIGHRAQTNVHEILKTMCRYEWFYQSKF